MKERLDVLLVSQGYAPSREKAKAIIMSGSVYVNGQKEDKAGSMFEENGLQLEVRGSQLKYVSRGGLKLEKAVNSWGLSLEGLVCMDIGASTGGFTDCMLQNGARKVYAVDVGHGQLAWKLREDERVVCMEKTNFRYMVPQDIQEELDFASVDVSFISLTKILIPARNLLRDGGQMVCLIKPQFEAGREKVGKKGVVRERSVHEEVIHKVVDFADQIGFAVLHLEHSPIKGPEGNIEYLVHIRKDGERCGKLPELSEHEAQEELKQITAQRRGLSWQPEWTADIADLVSRAHESLDKEGQA
ncbi:MAG: TlyA family RNA methyltransferase [Lachnospiraceae bacterium]|nr:TlyA family RNA methyltransferase [Lachnospiraceae bacterium]